MFPKIQNLTVISNHNGVFYRPDLFHTFAMADVRYGGLIRCGLRCIATDSSGLQVRVLPRLQAVVCCGGGCQWQRIIASRDHLAARQPARLGHRLSDDGDVSPTAARRRRGWSRLLDERRPPRQPNIAPARRESRLGARTIR